MRKSLGLLEVLGFVCAVEVSDVMAKTANVTVEDVKVTKGLGYVMVTVTGDVGAVNAAISAGEIAAKRQNAYITSKVIPRPIEGIFANTVQKEAVVAADPEPMAKEGTDVQPNTPPTVKTKPTSTGDKAAPVKPAAPIEKAVPAVSAAEQKTPEIEEPVKEQITKPAAKRPRKRTAKRVTKTPPKQVENPNTEKKSEE